MPATIIFDADDTLWGTEHLYEEARSEAVRVLSDLGLGFKSEIDTLTRDVDNRNFERLGFSPERFPASLRETYAELCNRKGIQSDPEISSDLEAIGEKVFQARAQSIPQAQAVLRALRQNGHKLCLWTQGDTSIQQRRIKESGLSGLFHETRIAVEKTRSTLLEALKEWEPSFPAPSAQVWVVGNSVKSDINPALEAGARAIWIPSHVWDREQDVLVPHTDGQLYLADTIDLVPQIVDPEDNDRSIASQTEHGQAAFLFVSAYHNLYRQYVLDILGYPRGYVFQFPYDNRWLPRPYRTTPHDFWAHMVGKTALVVFVHERMEGQPRRSQQFFPIRKATILGQPGDMTAVEGGMILVRFLLEDYVQYGTSGDELKERCERYNREILSLEARPRLTRVESAYMSMGPSFDGRISTSSDPRDDDQAWQSIVSVLGDLQTYSNLASSNPHAPEFPSPFTNAAFFRIAGLDDLSRKKELSLSPVFNGDSGYTLQGSRNYRLRLTFYHPLRPSGFVRHSRVAATFASDEVMPVGPTDIPLNFRYDHRHFDFITTQVFYESWAGLSLRIEPPSDAPKSEELQVVAPQPSFMLHLHVNRFLQLLAPFAFGVFAAVATLATQISAALVAAVPAWASYGATLSAAISITATIGSTSILYYLYRKLR